MIVFSRPTEDFFSLRPLPSSVNQPKVGRPRRGVRGLSRRRSAGVARENEVVPTSPSTGKAAGRLAVAYVPPGRCSRAGSRVHVQDQEARLGRLAVALHLSGLCTHLVLALTLHQLGGSGSSILSPAGGLWAAGLSFIGLPGCCSGGQALDRRYPVWEDGANYVYNVSAQTLHVMSSNPCPYVRVRVSCA